MEAAGFSNMLVTNHKTIQYPGPQDNNLNSYHCENPKFHNINIVSLKNFSFVHFNCTNVAASIMQGINNTITFQHMLLNFCMLIIVKNCTTSVTVLI
jgi:hypothetical protein